MVPFWGVSISAEGLDFFAKPNCYFLEIYFRDIKISQMKARVVIVRRRFIFNLSLL